MLKKCKIYVACGVYVETIFYRAISNSVCLLFSISLIILSLQRRPPEVVTDLFADIRDGVKLIKLLEVLTGQKLVSCDSG